MSSSHQVNRDWRFKRFLPESIGLILACANLTCACRTADVPPRDSTGVERPQQVADDSENVLSPKLIESATTALLRMQEDDGAWPYEGVYRLHGAIPIGYRAGGTSCVATALLYAGRGREDVDRAIDRALRFILAVLDEDGLSMSRRDKYDVRIWGQSAALSFLSQWLLVTQPDESNESLRKAARRAAESLAERIIAQEIKSGGWNYANQRYAASFVTGPVVQSLLWARAAGVSVPDELLVRSGATLKGLARSDGAVHYTGVSLVVSYFKPGTTIPGSAARAPVCATTLLLLGLNSQGDVRAALDVFFENWQVLEDRRKKTGTHEGPDGVAPYYFFFGHRYAAQAISTLPEADRVRYRKRLRSLLLRVQDEDGTWNDRVFARSRNYGTAMALLALLGDEVPLPPGLTVSR